MNGVGFSLLVLLSNAASGGGPVSAAGREPIVVGAAATTEDARRDRIPPTGTPGRTGSEATAQGESSRDPTRTPGKRSSLDPRPVGPEPHGSPANQGPGDAIGKTAPERPMHQVRKFPE